VKESGGSDSAHVQEQLRIVNATAKAILVAQARNEEEANAEAQGSSPQARRFAVSVTAIRPQVVVRQGSNQSVVTMLPHNQTYEILDAVELAGRWRVPVSWIREHTRARAPDPLPCVRLGKYVRFEWGSPALSEWWDKHRS
jgi:hypothetical protein